MHSSQLDLSYVTSTKKTCYNNERQNIVNNYLIILIDTSLDKSKPECFVLHFDLFLYKKCCVSTAHWFSGHAEHRIQSSLKTGFCSASKIFIAWGIIKRWGEYYAGFPKVLMDWWWLNCIQ